MARMSWGRYIEWWQRQVKLGLRTMPSMRELKARFEAYEKSERFRPEAFNNTQADYQQDRELPVDYYSSGNALIDHIRRRERVVHHIDGNNLNNDPANLLIQSESSIGRLTSHRISSWTNDIDANGVTDEQRMNSVTNGGYTYQEAIQMKACIVKVRLNPTNDIYSYLAPAGFNKDEHPLVLVGTGDKKLDTYQKVVVVSVAEVIDIMDDDYDGELKWIVGYADLENYNARADRETKRAKIIKQLEAVAEKKNTLEKLRKLTEGDENAAKLFDQLTALDNE